MTEGETKREATITVSTYTLSKILELPEVRALYEQRKRDIITMKLQKMSLESIGEVYGMSRERVRQIVDDA